MSKILDIKDLSIGYQKLIHENINIDLFQGQFVCLIGPNGIGKSTFLKTISRVISPIKGEIILNGIDLNLLNNKELSKSIGLVLTDHIDGFNLKAIDVIQMGRYPHTGFWGKLNPEDIQIIKEVVKEINIEDLVTRPFNELSDGEKQKIMIAKALVQKAPLMLLDEPTAFLDFPTKADLLILLRDLSKSNNMGVILSTHDIELAIKTADQIWLFTEDHEFIVGMPEDLVLDGHIEHVFKNKKMQFNQLTGHFERISKIEKSIRIIGETKELFWLSKALQRNNIGINNFSNISIEFKHQFILNNNNNPPLYFSSIEDVIHELNKIL